MVIKQWPHNYLHHETEPFQVLLIHWRSNKQLLTAEKAGPASSPHSGKAPPWWQKVRQLSTWISLQPKAKRENYMTLAVTVGLRANTPGVRPFRFPFCIFHLMLTGLSQLFDILLRKMERKYCKGCYWILSHRVPDEKSLPLQSTSRSNDNILGHLKT